MRLALGSMAIASGLALAGSAAAQDGAEAIHLNYSAGPDCPDRSAFESRILERTSRARFVEHGQLRTFEVSLHGGVASAGDVTVRRDGAVEGMRKVTGASCAEVAEELALVVTLAIDPEQTGRAAQTAKGANADGSSTDSIGTTHVPAGQPAVSPAPDVSLALRPSTTTRPAVQPRTEGPPVAPAAPAPHTLFLGIDGSIAGSVTPSSLVSVAPLVGWRPSTRSWLAPSLRASFAHASAGPIPDPQGEASFSWTVGRVEACLLAWPSGGAHLVACARLEAGVLSATGTGIPGARSKDRGWAAAGPLLRAEWELLGPLFVEADVAPMLRMTTDRFLFLPDSTVYSVPTVGLEADIGMGVHFL